MCEKPMEELVFKIGLLKNMLSEDEGVKLCPDLLQRGEEVKRIELIKDEILKHKMDEVLKFAEECNNCKIYEMILNFLDVFLI